jgi:hypothetical protein
VVIDVVVDIDVGVVDIVGIVVVVGVVVVSVVVVSVVVDVVVDVVGPLVVVVFDVVVDSVGFVDLAPEAAAVALSLVVSINVTTGGVTAANLPHCSKKARLSALCLSSPRPSSSTGIPPIA